MGREQARAIGIWAGIGSSALAAGPLLGGVLVQVVGWRAVFLLNVPIVLIATPWPRASSAKAPLTRTGGSMFPGRRSLRCGVAGLSLLPAFLPLSVLAPLGGRITAR